MAAQLGAAIGILGAGGVPALGQQPSQMEAAVGVAAVVGAAVGLFGAGQVVSLLQQRAQLDGRLGMTETVGAAIGVLGGRQIAAPVELRREFKRVFSIRPVAAGRSRPESKRLYPCIGR